MSPQKSSAPVGQSAELKPGLIGLTEDWSSDQRAFKNVPWGKAMMWIFLLSDTFIFSVFLIGYMTTRMSTAVDWPPVSEIFALSFRKRMLNLKERQVYYSYL